jgi:general stress protein 26
MHPAAHDELELKKLSDLIRHIYFGMLTTVEEDGTIRSRPMGTHLAEEFDGDLWFFTRATSPKVYELTREPHVNVSFSDPEKNVYISISGRASLDHDRGKMQELWSPVQLAWFPNGIAEPDIALIRVAVEKVEYWTSPSSTAVHVIGAMMSFVTGKPFEPDEHHKIDLEPDDDPPSR